ncbi:MAG: tRNA pseudouridine(55) synthase TruB [Bacilli bacterium]
MDGIIVINKPKNWTSRDVVNKLCKKLNTKKIGHTGTLDPIATGVLVLCVGRATKLVELLTCDDKSYNVVVKIGIETDTLDITGNIINTSNDIADGNRLLKVLNTFKGTYEQEVPSYSAVKVNGKKMYEYARMGKNISLPKRMVTVKSIDLLSCNGSEYEFKTLVSKGTYIRSLIRDINTKLGIIGTMSDLQRTRQGIFNLNDSYTLEDVLNDNYKMISIEEVLKDYFMITLDNELYEKVKDGALLENKYNEPLIVMKYKEKIVAIYKPYEKNQSLIKPYRMFIEL